MIRVLVWAEDRPLEIARTRMRELYRRGTDPNGRTTELACQLAAMGTGDIPVILCNMENTK